MIQLEQQQHEEFVVGWGGWLTPTTYIQFAGAGSNMFSSTKRLAGQAEEAAVHFPHYDPLHTKQ